MHAISNQLITFVVLTVLLFILVGIVMLILVDHKSKIPGEFQHNLFSITGVRREHPVLAFVTTFFLGAIIISLLLELGLVLGESFGVFAKETEQPALLKKISTHRYSESQRHFHNMPANNFVEMGKKEVCYQCHGDYPHAKQPMVRTLLNMHTQFIGCMTCHVDPDKQPEGSYRFDWLNYSGIDVDGPHFGTDVDPDTGYLIATDDYFSKIVVYGGADNELLEITEDNNDVREFLQIKDELSSEDKEAIKKRFHAQVMAKGRFCTRCHTDEEKSYLPFRDLGFSDQRISDVTNLNIVGIVEKYRDFYMPRLFDSKSPLPDKAIMLGDESKHDVPKQELLNGRAWWRKSDASQPIDKK